MKLLSPTILLIFLCLGSIDAKGQLIIDGIDESNFNLYSKWQSLNNSNLVIEISESERYIIFDGQDKLFELEFQIDNMANGIIEISLFVDSTDSEPGKATIQIVNQNRIRIYAWKHKTILDTADEYYRTEDLNSFPRLIKQAIKENE